MCVCFVLEKRIKKKKKKKKKTNPISVSVCVGVCVGGVGVGKVQHCYQENNSPATAGKGIWGKGKGWVERGGGGG